MRVSSVFILFFSTNFDHNQSDALQGVLYFSICHIPYYTLLKILSISEVYKSLGCVFYFSNFSII